MDAQVVAFLTQMAQYFERQEAHKIQEFTNCHLNTELNNDYVGEDVALEQFQSELSKFTRGPDLDQAKN